MRKINIIYFVPHFHLCSSQRWHCLGVKCLPVIVRPDLGTPSTQWALPRMNSASVPGFPTPPRRLSTIGKTNLWLTMPDHHLDHDFRLC